MSWTKNDMARVIIQALKNMDEPPAADHGEVLKMAKNKKKSQLEDFLNDAIEMIHRNKGQQ